MTFGFASAAWDGKLLAPPADGPTLDETLDRVRETYPGAEPHTVEWPCGAIMADEDDLLAEHLTACACAEVAHD